MSPTKFHTHTEQRVNSIHILQILHNHFVKRSSQLTVYYLVVRFRMCYIDGQTSIQEANIIMTYEFQNVD